MACMREVPKQDGLFVRLTVMLKLGEPFQKWYGRTPVDKLQYSSLFLLHPNSEDFL